MIHLAIYLELMYADLSIDHVDVATFFPSERGHD